MAKVLVNEENLTNIANAIREKNGETTTYKPGDMATAIQSISSGGGNLKIETQTYTPTEDEITHVFYHNLGVTPDFVNIYHGVVPTLSNSSTYSLINTWGYRDGVFSFGNNRYVKQMWMILTNYAGDGARFGYNFDDAIDATSTSSLLKNANSESVTFDGSRKNDTHLAAGKTYFIIMMSGVGE